MKKIMSIMLTVVMLASMMSVPMTAAADTVLSCSITPSNTYVHTDGTNTGTYPDGTNMNPITSKVYGFGGKAAADESISSLVPGQNTSVSDYNRVGNHKQYMGIGNPSGVGNGYVVLEANVFPVSEQSIGSVILQPNAGVGISPAVTAADGIVAGQWNNIRFVMQPSTASTTDSKYAKVWAYVNGVLVMDGEQQSGFSNENYRNPRRLMFDAGSYKEYDQHLYWDDMTAYTTDTIPAAPTMPVLTTTSKYTISGNKIVAADGLKLSDITQDGLTISAYNTNAPETALAADTVLGSGDVIVASSGTYMTCYTIKDNIDHTYWNNTTGAGINNATSATEVTQIMGRASNDKSIYATRTIDGNGINNHKFQYIASIGTAAENYGDLIVMGVSIYAKSNINNIMLTGNGGVNISDSYSVSDTSKNFHEGWNKVVFVYDHSTAGDEKGEYGGSWAAYVNGVCVNEMGENRKLMDADNPFNYIANGNIHQLRIMITAASTNDLEVYLDDAFCYRVVGGKEATLASFVQTTPAITAATNAEYTVSGTTITAAEGATVASLNATEGATVTAFTSDEFSYQLSSTDILEDGNKVVVAANGIFTYYTVTSSSAGNVIYSTRFSGNTYASGFTLANDGFFTAAYATGKAGKQTADTSLNFIRTAATGQPASWNGNNIYTYVYAPIDKAYIKYEMNFMPGDENFTYCGFKTQSHANISSFLYCTDAGTTENHVLNRYQWNKIVYVFKADSTTVDTSTHLIPGTYDLYVNGKQIANDVDVDIRKTGNSATATNMPIRFAVYGTDVKQADGNYNYSAISCFMDDIDIRWFDSEPEIKAMPYAIDDDGESVLIDGSTYTIYEDLKVSDIKYSEGANLTVFDVPTYDYYLIGSNALYNNNLIVVWDKYNQYTYYTVKKEIRNSATITPYVGYYVAKANLKDAVLLLAGFDEEGNMEIAKYANNSGNAEVRIDGDFDIVKAYIWNNLTDLTPLTAEKTYVSKPIVACWGASITYGQGATNWDTDTYPAQLASLTGFDVYNMGIGGETQTTIAARQGALDIKLTKDVTIPASGSVNIEFAAYDKDGTYAGVVTPRNASLAGWNPVTINGIEGTLSVVVNNDVWPRVLKSATFTRKTSGDAVEAKAGDIMTVEAHKINDAADITLICVSSNGGWSSENLTADDSQSSDLIALVDKMIAAAKDPDKYLVVGLTTGTANKWTNTHAALANYYGDKFLDVKDYITSEQALIDGGITITETDLEWIAAGHVPPSLINNPSPTLSDTTGYDNVHLNSAGYAAMARSMYNKFIELGYCAAE